MKAQAITLTIISSLLAAIWGYASFSKWIDHENFYLKLQASNEYGSYAKVLFYLIPSVEMVAGILLLAPSSRKLGLQMSLILLSIYTLYICYILTASKHIPCSCNGITSKMSWNQHLLFNAVLLLLVAIALIVNKNISKRTKLDYYELENPYK